MSAAPRSTAHLLPPQPRLVHAARALTVWVALGAASAFAQIVPQANAAPDQRPRVGSVLGGTRPVVRIAAPNAAGLSHNRYSRFDVDARGVILSNNTGTAGTELGVRVPSNPYLNGHPARVILNEVESSQASLLAGPIEVAGQRAEVIIANPAGITCNGCGFINASRAMLTTGQARTDGRGLVDFSVSGGTVEIGPRGMNSRRASDTALLAEKVQVNGPVYADQLAVFAGHTTMVLGADGNLTIVPVAARSTYLEHREGYSIDVAALGGMYANSIRLVTLGSDSGRGVALRASNRLRIASAGDLTIASDGEVATEAPMASGRDLTIQAPSVSLGSGVTAVRGIQVDAATISVGALVYAGAAPSSTTRPGAGHVDLNATQSLSVFGIVQTDGQLNLVSPVIDLNGSYLQGLGGVNIAPGQSLDRGRATLEPAGAPLNTEWVSTVPHWFPFAGKP